MTEGLLVLVQLVIAAITTSPCVRVYSCPSYTNGITVSCLSDGIANPCKYRLRTLYLRKSRNVYNESKSCLIWNKSLQETYTVQLWLKWKQTYLRWRSAIIFTNEMLSVMQLTLNPILLSRQLLKSDIISDTGTLSCGLLGPEQQGTTVDRSSSTTCQ